MTDYIQEMMRTARVDTVIMKRYCRGGEYRKHCLKICSFCKDNKHFFVYPDFTPEKQLEIIKLICINDYEFAVDIKGGKTIMYATPVFLNSKQVQAKNQNFSRALAQLTIELMDAGELDKEKVKEILEG